ncbi:MAG: hypothetical protein HLX46_02760 [Corynebacterium sp.]|uniref:Gp37-like protein n=1 Tax=Corynebacterium sp. TaxID=1720 RepID=UPI0017F0D32C|nr:hypothetical protein [Corynebacterium sp.]NWO15771.1 hypothetical protein [Corynebacterium sp.]
MVDWVGHRAHRHSVMREQGQWVGILDRNWEPVLTIEDWESATWGAVFGDTGSMEMQLLGHLADGSRNPAVEALLMADLKELDNPASMEQLFHSGIHIAVERPGLARRVYKVTSLTPEGGVDYPTRLTVAGADMVEHLKHLPLWADPSNRSKIVQLQFADIQQGSVEDVSRKLIGRNLIGYQQPSLLSSMFSWTDNYSNPSTWRGFNPQLHNLICSPIKSGLPSEWCIIDARWDNAWDLISASWQAAGVLPIVDLWLPGDTQPFPEHATLSQPTGVISFSPRSTVSGAAGLLSQGWSQLQRVISMEDKFTSVVGMGDSVPSADGRDPWVVFEVDEAPPMTITKSSDSRFLVGSQSPKGLNDVIEVGIKTVVAAIVAGIPGIGPIAAEIIKGGGELLSKMAADKFLVLNEFTDQARKQYHGRSGYISVAKPGAGNSIETLQKAWQAKTETAGGLSVPFEVADPYPYLPGRDFDLGDTVGIRAWGAIWAAYVSELPWTSTSANPVGWQLSIGNLTELKNMDELLARNAESVRNVIGRLSTFVGS